jgi:S1-C subfamily serine protease
MKPRLPHPTAVFWTVLAALLAAVLLTTAPPVQCATLAAESPQQRAQAMGRAGASIVGLRSVAVDGASSVRTLGSEREGSGIVISPDGLVLTIGYLVLEAQQVQLVTDDERTIPARVLAYDQATGFGLVQALLPLGVVPAALGHADELAPQDTVLVAMGGDTPQVSTTQLVARRPFVGYWEYSLDDALFTAPPRGNHSGAGLFNLRGELVGVGSLALADVSGPGQPRQPGNMFVPVDLLRPILAELRAQGQSALSRRAWLGISCVQHGELVHVARVTDDSPADEGGVQRGDRIVRIDGVPVDALATLWQALWRGGPAERDVKLDILRDGEALTLTLHATDRMRTLRRPEGI